LLSVDQPALPESERRSSAKAEAGGENYQVSRFWG
jgi:hypothetical protein